MQENNCTVCQPIRLRKEIFDQASHLPDPVPDEANKGHYQKFSDIFGTEITEIHLPSFKLMEQENMMGFTTLKQHVLITNLTIICTECDKPRLIYAQKKQYSNILRKFKQITSDLLFICNTTVSRQTSNNKGLSQLHIRGNPTYMISG